MERPPLTITIGEQEIKWTYGLSQDLQRLTPDPGMIMEEVATKASTRDYFIRRALTPLNKIVTEPDKELVPMEAVDLEPEQVSELLEWITAHLLFFMAKSMVGMKNLSEQFGKELGVTLTNPSSTGSEASAG